jgi:hypothetical protein
MSTSSWQGPPKPSVVSRNPLAFLDTAKPLPEHIAANVNAGLWARALVLNDSYKEPRPGSMSTMALVNMMYDEDLFSQPEESGIVKVGDYLANEPGAVTPNLEASDLYVYPATGDKGAPTYIDVTVVQIDAGAEFVLRIGSRRVQMFYLKALAAGAWPIKHRIARTNDKVGTTYGYTVLAPNS